MYEQAPSLSEKSLRNHSTDSYPYQSRRAELTGGLPGAGAAALAANRYALMRLHGDSEAAAREIQDGRQRGGLARAVKAKVSKHRGVLHTGLAQNVVHGGGGVRGSDVDARPCAVV